MRCQVISEDLIVVFAKYGCAVIRVGAIGPDQIAHRLSRNLLDRLIGHFSRRDDTRVELRAMDFRHPQHFLALLLALADGWTFATARPPQTLSLRERFLVALAVLAILMVGYRHYDVSNNWLDMQIAGTFPESAARYIEKRHLPGPLYNDFNDGGFLIWRLPWLPVAIDGRTNVHGDERVAHSSAVWSGKPGWDADPELLRANLILAAKDSTFAALLRQNPHYKIIFEDIQTVVFQPAETR
jgi:hypothetical protein